MIVQCPSCEARYRIGMENIPQQGGKIACPSCSQSFIVYPEAELDDATRLNNDYDSAQDVTRAGDVIVSSQMFKDDNIPMEDGTVEIQNPMKEWLEAQRRAEEQDDDAPTSMISEADLIFEDDDFEDDGKTEMINLGDFLDMEQKAEEEENYDATEVLTLDADIQAKIDEANARKGLPKSAPILGSAAQGNLKPRVTHKLPLVTGPSSLPPLGSPRGGLPKPNALPPLSNTLKPRLPQPGLPQPGLPQQGLPQPGLPQPSFPKPPQPGLPQPSAQPRPPQPAPMLGSAPVAVMDPNPTVSEPLPPEYAGIAHVNPHFRGPWKLRTNFGLTYEFPDTLSLNSWLSSRDDTAGYTLSGDGDFVPLFNFPQVKLMHAGTSGSFSMQQPSNLPPFGQGLGSGQFPNQGPVATLSQEVPRDEILSPPAKSSSVLPILAWLFCGFSAIVMVLTALYVFGIIGASQLTGIIMFDSSFLSVF